MLHRGRSHSRITVSVTMTVLAVMLFGTCAPTADMTAAEKACCASMMGDCQMPAAASCCTDKSHDGQSAVTAKPATPLVPVAALLAVLDIPVPTIPISSQRALVVESAAASPPGVPTYLFVSSFRI